MVDYPRTLRELERRSSTEEECRAYLAQLRWPDGFRCPRCGGAEAWGTRRGLRMCAGCAHQASATAGTIFQDTRTPLALWFRAIWWVMSQKNGASAQGVQRVLGLGSYRTAWTWLHKLRRAMVRPGRAQLTGSVEVDESFVGGVEPGGGRRHIGTKALVAIAAEVRGRAIGRIRLRRIEGSGSADLLPFITAAIARRSRVITDGHQGYAGLSKLPYRYVRRGERTTGQASGAKLPRVHRVASLLKRWLLGTHQGAVAREHLDYYLDEFVFRFNRRTSRHRGKLFYRLLQNAVAVAPAPYASLVKGLRGPKPRTAHPRNR